MERDHKRSRWKLPSRLAAVMAGRMVLLWLASGFCVVAVGDGNTREIRVAGGKVFINWDHKVHGPFEKGHPIRGVEFFCDAPGGPALAWRPSWVVYPSNGLQAAFPLCMILLPLAALILVASCRRRVAPPPGHCRKCGYDLTGNTSGRCPECACVCPESSMACPQTPKDGPGAG